MAYLQLSWLHAPQCLVHDDQLPLLLALLQVAYDVMDVDVPDFHADFGTFKGIITELEHRLGALIVQVRAATALKREIAHSMCCHCSSVRFAVQHVQVEQRGAL